MTITRLIIALILFATPMAYSAELRSLKTLVWSEQPFSQIDTATYEGMEDKDKFNFQTNRYLFLKATETALLKVNWTLGMGSLVGEKLVFVKDKVKSALSKEEKQEQTAFENMQETFRERSHRVVRNVIKALDRNLWEKAPVISRSNEFGVSAAVGIQALGGVGEKGWGRIIDLGLSFGYHKETKSLVFQIFLDREKFKSTMMKAVFIAGVVGKAGVYIANQKDSSQAPSRKGESFYPPMIPGFQSTTPELVNFGGSSGLTWPPSPLGDMMTYTTTLDNDALLRITISPIMKGFVRISSALIPTNYIVDKISELTKFFSRSAPAPLCGRMFAL
ncbi:MAG: hypothetical protein BroJett040_04960 [Oligoflexia bacterium]|nr:MAG: hypothetical protein BroJett040_04960 [Oligoflexia bacterium]